MNKIEKYNKILEMALDNNKGLETYINIDQLEQLTQPNLTEDYVSENNISLTETYKIVLVAYGFETFFDLYTYALSNTSKEEFTSKAKQYDTLDTVKQTVTRNGKKMDTTIYSELKDTDNKIKTRHGKEDSKPSKHQPELDLIPVILNNLEKPILSTELSALDDLLEPLTFLLGDNKGLDYIVLLIDAEYNPRASYGFVFEEGYISTGLVATDGTVDNIVIRVINELVNLGLNYQLAVTMPVFTGDEEIQRLIAESYNFEYNEELVIYTCDYKDLVETFGENYIALKENE